MADMGLPKNYVSHRIMTQNILPWIQGCGCCITAHTGIKPHHNQPSKARVAYSRGKHQKAHNQKQTGSKGCNNRRMGQDFKGNYRKIG